MTSSDLITPGDEHRDEIVGLMQARSTWGRKWRRNARPRLPVEKMRCVLEGRRIVAAAGARTSDSGGAGASSGMSGIWGVVTLPEHRGGGLATRAVTGCSGGACTVSAERAVPATQRPYRGMGTDWPGR